MDYDDENKYGDKRERHFECDVSLCLCAMGAL